MFLLVGIVLVLLLPSPWNTVAFAACLAVFLGEVLFWNRTVRHRHATAGAETLIGRTGAAISDCRPDGQVRLGGEIWQARCADGAGRGEPVVVTGREGLVLVVEPAPPRS